MKFKDRFKEPTTMLGLGAIIYGLGEIFKINEAPMIADSITQAAEPIANGDYNGGIALLLSGILGMFMREKSDR